MDKFDQRNNGKPIEKQEICFPILLLSSIEWNVVLAAKSNYIKNSCSTNFRFWVRTYAFIFTLRAHLLLSVWILCWWLVDLQLLSWPLPFTEHPHFRPLYSSHFDTQNKALPFSFKLYFLPTFFFFFFYHLTQETHLVSQLKKFENIFHFNLFTQLLWPVCHKITSFPIWNTPWMYPYSLFLLWNRAGSLVKLIPSETSIKRFLCGVLWIHSVLLSAFQFIWL